MALNKYLFKRSYSIMKKLASFLVVLALVLTLASSAMA